MVCTRAINIYKLSIKACTLQKSLNGQNEALPIIPTPLALH